MAKHKWVVGDWASESGGVILDPNLAVSLVIADPVYATDMVRYMWEYFAEIEMPTIMFMYPEDVQTLGTPVDQLCHWVKPVSTKNTCKKYSRFVEAIALRGVIMNTDLHWSNRTGIFTDVLLDNKAHPWKKPESLIERLILNHYPGHGAILDPCAGSGTTEDVCRKLGIDSVCIELDEQYSRNNT